jgi:hypothetical protein
VWGSAVFDGPVADGLGGVMLTKVGVGAGGGGRVSAGSAGPDGTMTDGVPAGACTATLSPGTAGDDDFTGSVARGRQSTTDEVGAVVAFGGAAPIPPAPAGALAGAGAGAGVPACQPAVTANGRPRATTLKKMDLGENRTSTSPVERPKSYGVLVFAPNSRPGDRLIS